MKPQTKCKNFCQRNKYYRYKINLIKISMYLQRYKYTDTEYTVSDKCDVT